jgi:hypothetical protein
MFFYEFATGKQRTLAEIPDAWPSHVEVSPADHNLVRYCLDRPETERQRMFTVRLDDGREPRMLRVQERGEMITHEFFWPGARLVGYTYQDQRHIPVAQRLPWAEYMPVPTQLGICDLEGREIYLSDPLNCYHTHIYVSPDGKWIRGEGTDGKFFVYAAPFCFDDTKIDLQALATIHTPYHRFTGQKVDCNFSKDAKWLLFNDTIEGKLQVCAVAVS